MNFKALFRNTKRDPAADLIEGIVFASTTGASELVPVLRKRYDTNSEIEAVVLICALEHAYLMLHLVSRISCVKRGGDYRQRLLEKISRPALFNVVAQLMPYATEMERNRINSTLIRDLIEREALYGRCSRINNDDLPIPIGLFPVHDPTVADQFLGKIGELARSWDIPSDPRYIPTMRGDELLELKIWVSSVVPRLEKLVDKQV